MLNHAPRVQFPRVEALRAQAHQIGFSPVDADEAARLRRAAREAVAVNQLEQLYATPEEAALYQMMDDERMPLSIRTRIAQAFIDLDTPAA